MNKDIRPPEGVLVQNRRGLWVPAIVEPYYFIFRKRCECGDTFWTYKGYRGHYALAHILALDRKK